MTDTRPRLVTTRNGGTVHIATCWQARRPDVTAAAFNIAGSRDLAIEIATTGLEPCRRCKPVSRLAWWERSHR